MRLDYDNLAAEYGRHRTVHPGVLRRLIERGGLTAGSRVLEVGCGTGNYLSAIHDATGCAATGVDPSEAMLATARERAPRLTWLNGKGEALPVADGTFDLVYSVDVIHHVQHRPAHVDETIRVLAPGGWFCIATDSEEDILRRAPLSSYFPETIEIELTRYPRIATLTSELACSGFKQIEIEQVELEYELTDAQSYRDRAFSSLHLLADDAFARGIERLETELASGPITAMSLYTLIWASI